MTPSERKRQYNQRHRASLTPEKKAARTEYLRAWRAAQTPEQVAERSARKAARRRAQIAARSPEEAAQFLARRAEQQRDRRAAGRDKYDDRVRRGWSTDAVRVAFAAQGGRCAICERQMVLGGNSPTSVHADHDHETGRPRALLCASCNRLEGLHLSVPVSDEVWGFRVAEYRARFRGDGERPDVCPDLDWMPV